MPNKATNTRRQPCLVPLGVLMLGLASTGCTQFAERRDNADQHWGKVRANMKYQLASQQFENGQIETAIDTLSEAIGVNPEHADALVLLANCRLEQGKPAAALQAIEKARHWDPQSAEVEYVLGVIAERTERPVDALDHFRRARCWDEHEMDYLVAEAECLAALGRPEEAAALVSGGIGRFDSDGTLEMLLAQICLLIDDRETSLHNYRLAMERSGCGAATGKDGGCDALTEEFGRLLSETGRHTEAVGVLRAYMTGRDNTPSSVVNSLAVSYLATGRVEDAKRILREQLRRHPDHAPSWMILARAAIRLEDWMTARRCTDRLDQLTPRNAKLQLLRGFVCWKQNDLSLAEVALRRAVDIDPADPLGHCLLGQVLESTNRGDTARQHYSRALQLDPQCAWAKQLLGMPATDPPMADLGDAPAEPVARR